MKSDVAASKTLENDLHLWIFLLLNALLVLAEFSVSGFLILPRKANIQPNHPNQPKQPKPTKPTKPTKPPKPAQTNQTNQTNQTTQTNFKPMCFFASGLHISWEHRRLSGQRVGQCCVAQCRVWRSSSAPQVPGEVGRNHQPYRGRVGAPGFLGVQFNPESILDDQPTPGCLVGPLISKIFVVQAQPVMVAARLLLAERVLLPVALSIPLW